MQGSTRIDELRQKFHENPRRYFAPLANEYRKAGDPEQAIAICRAHLAQQPGHMSGHVVYGQALYDAKRTDEARVVFEKALELDPDNAIVLKQLGDITREKGDTSEARHWYSRALDADPNDRETAAYLAELAEPVTEDAPVEAAPAELSRAEETSQADPVADDSISEESIVAGEVETPLEIEAVSEPEVEQPITVSAEDEVSWRKTPPHEESPFVTRTMAELYASQGYRQAALDVYRQLALQHPEDKDIFDRIDALEQDERGDAVAAAPPVESDSPPEVEDARAPEPVAFEPMISDLPVEAEPQTFTELSDESFFPSSEDLNLHVTATPPKPEPHFTDNELSTGDTWDTDSWGAGFDAEEDLNLDFDSPDIPAPVLPSAEPEPELTEPTEPEAAPSPETEMVVAPEPEMTVTPEPEMAVAPEPEVTTETPAEAEAGVGEAAGATEVAPEKPVSQQPEQPEPILSEPAAEDLAEEPDEEGAEDDEPVALEDYESIGTAELEGALDDESHFVAYSPQLPEDDDLPHYAAKGPTVREFFATLGAFRPSSQPGSSITAHAANPAPTSDFPLASDAFANMFSDSPVSDEDSRAAFALSGALGSTEPTSAAITAPVEPQQPAETPSTSATQESEEDIRRFREWLDGLAES